jgi:hypothetical protein
MRWLAAMASALLMTGCASVGTAQSRTAQSGTAVGPSSMVVSPPVAASSPVDVGSETPQPLPTPVFGSEGTLPPLPPGGRSLDTADPDSVWAAQNVIDVFAEEVSAVSQDDPAYCDVALDPVHDGLTVWWHGTPSAAALEVMHRARLDHINAVMVPAMFGHRALGTASGQIEGHMQELGITMMNVANDCSGVDIGLATVTPQGEAAIRALVDPSIPLLFKQEAYAVAL